MPREVNKLFESFKADRLIEVVIGDAATSINVSESLLKRNSVVFENILQSKQIVQSDVLKFPDDDLDAWKLILFWMFNKRVPNYDESEELSDPPVLIVHLVQSWCLGEQYCIPLFQDAVMLELLKAVSSAGDIPIDAVETAFEKSEPDSAISVLMAHGAIYSNKHGRLDESALARLCQAAPGFAKAFYTVRKRGRNWLKWHENLTWNHLSNQYLLCRESFVSGIDPDGTRAADTSDLREACAHVRARIYCSDCKKDYQQRRQKVQKPR